MLGRFECNCRHCRGRESRYPRRRLWKRREARGYAKLAAEQAAEDEERRATARRRRPTWADE
jgi:hypothetical protein